MMEMWVGAGYQQLRERCTHMCPSQSALTARQQRSPPLICCLHIHGDVREQDVEQTVSSIFDCHLPQARKVAIYGTYILYPRQSCLIKTSTPDSAHSDADDVVDRKTPYSRAASRFVLAQRRHSPPKRKCCPLSLASRRSGHCRRVSTIWPAWQYQLVGLAESQLGNAERGRKRC